MPVYREDEVEEDAINIAVKMMAATVRTAPKARGVDRLSTVILTGEDKDKLAEVMEKKAKQRDKSFFKRDADNLRNSPIVLLIGVKGTVPKKPEDPLDCGACGHPRCTEFMKVEKRRGPDFTGPICIFEAIDIGIALGSAVKLASDLGIDNRIMYTIGSAAVELKLLDADVVMGVPLSISGKNIYFDRRR